ncbi:MAG: DUF6351 family protein [Aeromicrobium sp.]|uniref:DUF6351 family protein n=1 Tax=Aeromicrobium sp. TaxID=1871063 RepID=UPI0039E50CD8
MQRRDIHHIGRLGAWLVAALTATLLVAPLTPAAAADGELRLETLSNRADLVFDGNALLRVTLPAGADPADLRVWVARDRHKDLTAVDREVTSAFAVRPNGQVEGLVTDLDLGANELTARLPDGRGAWLTITNHPRGGPIFAGPQLEPWRCQDGAVDEDCTAEPQITWQYKSTDPSKDGLQEYDPADPPGDVATTTTDEGVTIPFVVRVETGYQDRDQYRIAMLWQPDREWDRWSPQEQWNGKIFIPHGGNCGVAHRTGLAPTQDYSGTLTFFLPDGAADAVGDSPTVALSRGFATVSTALSNTGHNCSVASGAESLMMAKEHFAETYGSVRYTIGSGCSGGSIAQQTIANAYPGIYQGLITTCSFPDALTPGLEFTDTHLLRLYFEGGEGMSAGFTPPQWAAVEGHLSHLNAISADELLYKEATDPTTLCPGIDESTVYDPETNPAGVRCSIIDGSINIFGPRDPSVWTPAEQAAGRGFAALPFGNVGVQYGLNALKEGIITAEQFVSLNEDVGGLTIDIQPQAERTEADPTAVANAYRSGMLDTASNLSEVAIIDHRGPDPGIAHDARFSWVTRDRLIREQGNADNQVIWYGAFPLIGDPGYSTQALLEMDRWLSTVEADSRDVPLSQKIVQARETENIHDRCSNVSGTSDEDGVFLPLADPVVADLTGGAIDLADGLRPALDPASHLVVDPVSETLCGLGPGTDLYQTRFDSPRIVAGDGNYSDNSDCVLRPLDPADYTPQTLSEEQVSRLQAVFPDGVCDYSQPSPHFTQTVAWMTYQAADGSVVYGGEPLAAAPVSTPFSGGAPTTGSEPGGQMVGQTPALGSGSGIIPAATDALPNTGTPYILVWLLVIGFALAQADLLTRLRGAGT